MQYNCEIFIGGLTFTFYHRCEKHDPKLPMAICSEISWLGEFSKFEGYKILLDHHPKNFELYTRNMDINLILSSHNHGSQIRLFGKGLYARNQGLFPKCDGGVYENILVVSRGLANSIAIPRLFDPTEVIIL